MHNQAESVQGYCGLCKRETTWVFYKEGAKHYWKCLGCGVRRNAGP